jgi:hypothetical protein
MGLLLTTNIPKSSKFRRLPDAVRMDVQFPQIFLVTSGFNQTIQVTWQVCALNVMDLDVTSDACLYELLYNIVLMNYYMILSNNKPWI